MTHLFANRLISLALFAGCLALAVQLGHSIVNVFNRPADAVVHVLRRKTRVAPQGGSAAGLSLSPPSATDSNAPVYEHEQSVFG